MTHASLDNDNITTLSTTFTHLLCSKSKALLFKILFETPLFVVQSLQYMIIYAPYTHHKQPFSHIEYIQFFCITPER